MIDQFEGVSRLSVATPGLPDPPDASGSIPPYLFTNGENRINGSSTVVYTLAALIPNLFVTEEERLYPKLIVLIFTNDPSKYPNKELLGVFVLFALGLG